MRPVSSGRTACATAREEHSLKVTRQADDPWLRLHHFLSPFVDERRRIFVELLQIAAGLPHHFATDFHPPPVKLRQIAGPDIREAPPSRPQRVSLDCPTARGEDDFAEQRHLGKLRQEVIGLLARPPQVIQIQVQVTSTENPSASKVAASGATPRAG